MAPFFCQAAALSLVAHVSIAACVMREAVGAALPPQRHGAPHLASAAAPAAAAAAAFCFTILRNRTNTLPSPPPPPPNSLQAEAERQKLAKVPGMLNPYDNLAGDDMNGGSD